MQCPLACPETERVLSHLEKLPCVKDETKRCIANLLNYHAVGAHAWLPKRQSAAVLVPLFVGRSGELQVILTRRSDALRAFAGDTALPGGKMDAQDLTVEDTARREAFEEIGLPQDKERLPLLCVMDPVLVKANIVVTPVVVLILDYGLQPSLNPSEVASIFARPLVSFLSSTPRPSSGHTTDPNNPYYSFTDIRSDDRSTIRFHRFLTSHEEEGVKPVFGVTALILITTATIGYERTPDFEILPPKAPTQSQRIAYALLTPGHLLRNGCELEGVDVNKLVTLLLRPPVASNHYAVQTIGWEEIGVRQEALTKGDDAKSIVGHINRTERYTDKVHRVKEPVDEESGQGCKDFGEEHQVVIPDVAMLMEFLDRVRDVMNDRLKGDGRRLVEVKKAYWDILHQVRADLDKVNLMSLPEVISKEGQSNLEGGGMRRHPKMEKYPREDGDGSGLRGLPFQRNVVPGYDPFEARRSTVE